VHGVIRWVALEDLGKSLVDRDPLPRGTGRHVDQGEEIQLVRVRLRELRQGISQAAFLSLIPRTRVIRDQGNDTRWRVLIREPPRTVDGMETRIYN
jgi:hypothetical protein